MDAKVTYIFNMERNGWSETWYVKEVSGLTDAMTAAKNVAPFRMLLMAPGANIEAIRVSDDSDRGDSLLEPWHKTTKGGAASGDNSDAPWNAWLVSVRSGAHYRRSMFLRGMPDAWCFFDSTTGQYVVEDNMLSGLAKFQAAANENKFAIKAISRNGVTNPTKAITGMVLNGVRWEMTSVAHGLTEIQKVNVWDVQGDPAKQANGIRTVAPKDENVLTIIDQEHDQNPLYLGYGKLRKRGQSYFIVDKFLPMRPSKRDTGRRFFVSRGRQPAKRS